MTHMEFEDLVKRGLVSKIGFVEAKNKWDVNLLEKYFVEKVKRGGYFIDKAYWATIRTLRGAKIYTEVVGNIKLIFVWFTDRNRLGVFEIRLNKIK